MTSDWPTRATAGNLFSGLGFRVSQNWGYQMGGPQNGIIALSLE